MDQVLNWISTHEEMFYVVFLMIFVGIEVIGRVPSVLHTPLMSGANAIHGVILVGAIVVADHAKTTLEIVISGKHFEIKKIVSGVSDQYSLYIQRTIAFKTRDIIELGGYPDLYLKEDYGLWAKVVASGKPVKNLDSVLVTATAGSDMIKRRGGVNYVISEIKLFKLLSCLCNSIIFSSEGFNSDKSFITILVFFPS